MSRRKQVKPQQMHETIELPCENQLDMKRQSQPEMTEEQGNRSKEINHGDESSPSLKSVLASCLSNLKSEIENKNDEMNLNKENYDNMDEKINEIISKQHWQGQ